MPDCTLCTGNNIQSEKDDTNIHQVGICPARNECYRYTTKPNPFRQSYFFVAPFKTGTTQVDEDGYRQSLPWWQCDYFWDDKNA